LDWQLAHDLARVRREYGNLGRRDPRCQDARHDPRHQCGLLGVAPAAREAVAHLEVTAAIDEAQGHAARPGETLRGSCDRAVGGAGDERIVEISGGEGAVGVVGLDLAVR